MSTPSSSKALDLISLGNDDDRNTSSLSSIIDKNLKSSKMKKRKAGSDENRLFNQQWESEFLFIESPSGKPLCIVCEKNLSLNKRHDVNRHYMRQHRVEIEEKFNLVKGSELRKEYLLKKKAEIKNRQSLFINRKCKSTAMTAASYEIALALAKKKKPFTDGEEIVKPCLEIFGRRLGDDDIKRKVNELPLSKQTITRRTEDLSNDVCEQVKVLVQASIFFSLALYETVDITDTTQLCIFVRGIDDNFNVFEELIGLESLHGSTKGLDIFEKLKLCLENLELDWHKLISICTNGSPSLIGKNDGTITLLERFLDRSLMKYHCIIHQESLCGKNLNLQDVMSTVVKCVKKIQARALNRKEFREYCDMLELEYGDLFHCEMYWLSRGKVLSRFWQLKKSVHDYLEEKNELPEERALLCNTDWLFDLAFLVDITSHLNDLNLKLQGRNKLFPNLVNDINAFKMKLRLWISQLEAGNLDQFQHLKLHSKSADARIEVIKYIEKLRILQDSFECRFSDFAEEEDKILTFLNPFSISVEKIKNLPSNIQMEIIDLQTNLIMKTKYNELPSIPNASDMIHFWKILPSEHFPNLRKFAQSYICRFGSTYRCEQAFSIMKLIKNKQRSRLTDSNLKNSLLLSLTDLTPNIEKLVKSKQAQKSH